MVKVKLFILIVLITMVGSSLASEGFPLYTFTLHYDHGVLTSSQVDLLYNEMPLYSFSQTEYVLQVVSFNDVVLYELAFGFDFSPPHGALHPSWFDDEGNQIVFQNYTKSPEKVTSDVILVVPYYTNAESIVVFQEENLLLEIDVSEHAICNENSLCDLSETLDNCPQDCTCGNDICDTSESYFSCSQDCMSGEADGACDGVAEGVCDPDCTATDDLDCKQPLVPEGRTFLFVIGMVVLIILVALILAWKRRKKPSVDLPSPIKKYIADSRKSGVSDDQIRQALLQSGWEQSTVKAALREKL